MAAALIAGLLVVGAPAAETAPGTDTIDVVLVGRRSDAAIIEKQITEIIIRAAAKVRAEVEGPSRPLVEVMRKPSDTSSESVSEFRISLPEGVSREAFLQALTRDEACRAGAEACALHCALVAKVATGGHWHMKTPAGDRQCLAVLAPSPADQADLWRLVASEPADLGLQRRPRVGRVRITFGRPDFSALPK